MRTARGLVLSILFMTVALNGAAELQTTYVSSRGSDVNACDQAAPCREVNRALAETAVGGTVIVLDAGPYAFFSTNKGVTIAAGPGAQPSFQGIAVDTPAGQSTTLRGLTSITNGPRVGIFVGNGAGSTRIESCVVSNSRKGIVISTAGPVTIVESRISSSRSGPSCPTPPCIGYPVTSDVNGIEIVGPATVTIDSSRIWDHTHNGVLVFGPGRVDLRRTTVSENTNGIAADARGGRLEMSISNCAIGKNRGVGIAAGGTFGGTARVLVGFSTITGNQYGIRFDEKTAAIIDEGGNTLSGNGTDGAFARGVEP